MFSIFTGRASHATVLVWFALLSFFYLRWLFWSETPGLSPDGVYFGLLLTATLAYFIHFTTTHHRLALDKPLAIHLLVIALAAVTLVWTPSKFAGLSGLSAMIFGWLFHYLSRNTLPDKAKYIFYSLLTVFSGLLLLTLVSIVIGWTTGMLHFDIESDTVIGDTPGLFIMPIDLVSCITFFILPILAVGNRRPFYLAAFALASCVLALNFSRTYMAATLIAWIAFLVVRAQRKRLAVGLLTLFALVALSFAFTTNPLSRQLFFDPDMTIALFASEPLVYLYAINSSGRLNIWDYLITEAMSSGTGLLAGAGIGATQEILAHNPFGLAGYASHSDYIKLLADFGIVGIVIYLVLLFLLARRFLRMLKRQDSPMLSLVGSAGFMLVVYIAIGGIGYEMLRPRGGLLVLFLLLGISSSLAAKGSKRGVSPDSAANTANTANISL